MNNELNKLKELFASELKPAINNKKKNITVDINHLNMMGDGCDRVDDINSKLLNHYFGEFVLPSFYGNMFDVAIERSKLIPYTTTNNEKNRSKRKRKSKRKNKK